MQHRVSDAQPFGEEMSAIAQFIAENLGSLNNDDNQEPAEKVECFLASKSMAQLLRKDWQTQEGSEEVVSFVESVYEYASSLGLPPAATTIVLKREVSGANGK